MTEATAVEIDSFISQPESSLISRRLIFPLSYLLLHSQVDEHPCSTFLNPLPIERFALLISEGLPILVF